MKKLFIYQEQVAIGNGEYYDTSIYTHLHYAEPKEKEEYVIDNFEKAYEIIKENKIFNASVTSTLFRNRPQIQITYGGVDLRCIRMTKKNFKPIKIQKFYTEYKYKVTIQDLIRMLPADEFCEWLKDHDVTQIGSI